MVYCYCNYGGVDITGWHHLVSSATAWGKLEFSRRAGSVDYFRCRCSGWSGRNPMGFCEIVPVKPSNTEPMICFHGCAAIFNQAIPPYQAESPDFCWLQTCFAPIIIVVWMGCSIPSTFLIVLVSPLFFCVCRTSQFSCLLALSHINSSIFSVI